MNILLWILQIVLALFALSGGSFKIFSYEQLAQVPSAAALSQNAWAALGVFEMVCGVLVIVAAFTKWKKTLVPLAAALLALENLALAGMYATYSTEFAVTNPLVWAAGIALVAAFVAYGRCVFKPLR